MDSTDNLPDTLTPKFIMPSTDRQSIDSNSVIIPWAQLSPCLDSLPRIDVIKDEHSVGRSQQCDTIINDTVLPTNQCVSISKQHFRIQRGGSSTTDKDNIDSETDLVHIWDDSKNGTFLNSRLIGRGQRNILQSGDIISIGQKNLKAFVFKPLFSNVANDYIPSELNGWLIPTRILGRGAFGEVRLAYDKCKCVPYAVKKIHKSRFVGGSSEHQRYVAQIHNEVNILTSLSHPLIIVMRQIVDTEHDVFIVFEYMSGGELTNRILSLQPLTESNIKYIFYQIVLAVEYLHNMGITHRDLKPANVLLSSDETDAWVKITDFGLSKIADEYSAMQTICGTPNFVAPEILDEHILEYNHQVDVWSLGVILFYMFHKQLPFRSSDKHRLNEIILSGRIDWSNNEDFFRTTQQCNILPHHVRDLIQRMLTVTPEERITITEIQEHIWLTENDEIKQKVDAYVQSYQQESVIF